MDTMSHSQTPKQAKILALILEEIELFLEQGILPASSTPPPEASPAPPTEEPSEIPTDPAAPEMPSDPLADMPGIGGDETSSTPPGMPGMEGMEDLDPEGAMDGGMEGEEASSNPIEDMIGALGAKTVTDIKKTLVADLQAGDKRKQAEDLIAQAKAGEDEVPFNIKQAVGEIEKTFHFTFPAKAKGEDGEKGDEEALMMEAHLKSYLKQTFSKKGK